jgi:hypothetical protein
MDEFEGGRVNREILSETESPVYVCMYDCHLEWRTLVLKCNNNYDSMYVCMYVKRHDV